MTAQRRLTKIATVSSVAKFILYICLINLCFGAWVAPAMAADVTLQWNANSEPDLSGYKLHYGTSAGVYTTSVNVGNVTTRTVSGLSNNTRYYFAVTAYDSSGNESGYSVEFSWSNDTLAPSAPTNLRKSN